jgi:hypothetical protein
MQNKEFNQLAEIGVIDQDQILRINARDGLTFFRLHHEIDEINRKKENFEKMKEKYFDKKNPKDLVNYDKELDRFDDANHQQKTKPQNNAAKNMTEKDKELVETAVNKITIKKDKIEKNSIFKDFFNGLNDAKEQNRKNDEEKRALF